MGWDLVRIILGIAFQFTIYFINAGRLINAPQVESEDTGRLKNKTYKDSDQQTLDKARFKVKIWSFKSFGLLINLGVMLVCAIGGVSMMVTTSTDTGARIITCFVNTQFMFLHDMSLLSLSLLGISKTKVYGAQFLNIVMCIGQYYITLHLHPQYHNYFTLSIYSLTINNKWFELIFGFGIDALLCFWALTATTTKNVDSGGYSKRYLRGVRFRRMIAVALLLMDLLISLLPPNRYMYVDPKFLCSYH